MRVIEIRGNRDHCVSDFFAQVVFRRLLQLLQNHGRDLGRGVLLALGYYDDMIAVALDLVGDHLHLFVDFVIAASHEPLDRVNRVLRVSDGLALGHLSD